MDFKSEIAHILSTAPLCDNIEFPIQSDGIALYGAGAMGEMALDFFEKINVLPKYIIDNHKKGLIRGIEIINPIDIPKNDFENLTFIVCVVTSPILPIVKFLQELGCQDTRHFYDYTEIMLKTKLTNGWSCFNLKQDDFEAITNICNALEHDPCSLAHYLQFLWWRIRRIEKIYPEYPVLSNKKYFKAPCMPKLTDSERLLDAGAHFGTTIESFLEITNEKFETIWAIEPDRKNLTLMKQNFEKVSKINYMSIALSDKNETIRFVDGLGFASKIEKNGNTVIQSQTIDSLNINPTIIKLHIEGYELNALNGAKNTIKIHRPILMVLADHNSDGLYKIANFVSNFEDYTLFFYLHDYCGNSAIFYYIPNERLRNE